MMLPSVTLWNLLSRFSFSCSSSDSLVSYYFFIWYNSWRWSPWLSCFYKFLLYSSLTQIISSECFCYSKYKFYLAKSWLRKAISSEVKSLFVVTAIFLSYILSSSLTCCSVSCSWVRIFSSNRCSVLSLYARTYRYLCSLSCISIIKRLLCSFYLLWNSSFNISIWWAIFSYKSFIFWSYLAYSLWYFSILLRYIPTTSNPDFSSPPHYMHKMLP